MEMQTPRDNIVALRSFSSDAGAAQETGQPACRSTMLPPYWAALTAHGCGL